MRDNTAIRSTPTQRLLQKQILLRTEIITKKQRNLHLPSAHTNRTKPYIPTPTYLQKRNHSDEHYVIIVVIFGSDNVMSAT